MYQIGVLEIQNKYYCLELSEAKFEKYNFEKQQSYLKDHDSIQNVIC